jgi:nifR3 family TIM-barrel protein
MKGFWDTLPRPFFVLAPLANVTDAAFRRVIATYSKPAGPAVFWTEFVSADGLVLAHEEGKKKLLRDLVYTEAERPIVAQFFTANPEHMEKAAALARELGFDGVDINMGCPDKSIEKQGAGAKLITTPDIAREIIRAAKRGAGDLPVSVKTRLGYNKDILEEWLPVLLEEGPAAITIHARTRKEMSKVAAHWDRVKRAVEIRNEMKSNTLILGNGDALDIEDARKKAEESGADGVMLGRAIFGKPWLFSDPSENRLLRVHDFSAEKSLSPRAVALRSLSEDGSPSVYDRLQITIEHTKLFEELLGDIKNFAIMKKHFKAYVEGFDGAKELRIKLMDTHNAQEVENAVEEFLQ